jgi:type II secretory pathway component GspD/PulD (secretin)
LSYVPRINEDGFITASVFVEVSTPILVTLGSGTSAVQAYQITTRSAQTNVRMKDGDTMVIGGLISSTDTKSLSKVPILGDLPVLGKLFQSVSKSNNETEVVIFLKAKIVK